MVAEEKVLVFDSGNHSLVGILHRGSDTATRGVVLLVGGPQYRVGSHRQFVLLARHLAQQGIPVLRFDHTGIGDSSGDHSDFENIGDDIRAAIDCLIWHRDGVSDIVLWGLCDAASAAMMFASTDARVCGMVLLNPWARTESGQAQSIIKHYYARRIFSRDFWRKTLSGAIDARQSIRSFMANLKKARNSKTGRPGRQTHFTERMLIGLERFEGPTLFIISGRDLTAAEFIDMTKASRRWQSVLERDLVEMKTLDAADHTFSSDALRKQVNQITGQWVGEL